MRRRSRTAELAVAVLLAAISSPLPGRDAAEVTPDELATQATRLGGTLIERSSSVQGPSVRIPATAEGSALRLPAGLSWSEARFLTTEAYLSGEDAGEVLLCFFAADETEARLRVSLQLLPDLPTTLVVPLSALDGQTLTLPRTPGRLRGTVRGHGILPRRIDHVTVQLAMTPGAHSLELGVIHLASHEPPYRVRPKPLVDALGQWVAREWAGKTPSDSFLGTDLAVALEKNKRARYPQGWCARGGMREKVFKPTGFFHTHHDGTRWWLVDPEGHGFFSLGLDAVRPGETAVVLPGTEPLFGPLPPRTGPLGEAWDAPSGSAVGDGYSFGLANLIRSFGPGWRRDWTDMTRSRLLAWRFNTLGSGSDPHLVKGTGLPYVISMPPYPTTRTLLYRDFPDVYAEEFRVAAREYARHLGAFRDDPNLIGYFMHDEPAWTLDGANIASEMLEANPSTDTRRALAHWLARRYKGNATKWAAAWGLGLESFDDVVDRTVHRAAERSEVARRDLWAFSKEMVRAYLGVPGLECHAVDPRHLNLGMRYAEISSELLYEAVGVFNVFSINAYDMDPPADAIAEIAERTHRPVMIGEFHFGALDRGLPSAGRRGVESQRERGIAYRHYVEAAAANPNVVGSHYYRLNDGELPGDADGGSDQIGFVDVCQRPYAGLVGAATRAHESVYPLMEGLDTPYPGRAREIPRTSTRRE